MVCPASELSLLVLLAQTSNIFKYHLQTWATDSAQVFMTAPLKAICHTKSLLSHCPVHLPGLGSCSYSARHVQARRCTRTAA